MSRIHPGENRCIDLSKRVVVENVDQDHSCCTFGRPLNPNPNPNPNPFVLTVWKRSSMSFQGTDGFTVFDSSGRLAFRVDNYTRKIRLLNTGAEEVVLMDGSGNALFTLRPQMFMSMQMQYQWNGYKGEIYGGSPKCREFIMRRRSAVIYGGSREFEAEVVMGGSEFKKKDRIPDFKVEGSFWKRNCKIKSSSGAVMAQLARKRVNSTILLSDDVFSLVVETGVDVNLIMAFVVILDRISPKPFAPVLCS